MYYQREIGWPFFGFDVIENLLRYHYKKARKLVFKIMIRNLADAVVITTVASNNNNQSISVVM